MYVDMFISYGRQTLQNIHNDYINDFFWNKMLSLAGGGGH